MDSKFACQIMSQFEKTTDISGISDENQMKLVIDIGNSNCKIGLFDGKELLEKRIFPNETIENEIIKFLKPNLSIEVIVSNVGKISEALIEHLTNFNHVLYFNSKTPIPINNNYLSPETLGNDRLCGAIGAQSKFPGLPILVIDVGSCITYDFIDKNKHFMGGSISPGIGIRLKSLQQFTERLPLIKNEDINYLTGNTTKESILSGVINGIIFEIDGFINTYKEKHEDLKTLITGGDAPYLAKKLKNPIFADPDLVLLGLNCILDYQINRNT